MKYTVVPKSWTKRRAHELPREIINVEVDDLKKEKNHFCYMTVYYKDGGVEKYFSRVLRNHINGKWFLDGMHVAIEILEF